MSERISTSGQNQPCAVFKDLGLLDFSAALKVQQQLFEQKIVGKTRNQHNACNPDYILFVEHPLVLTLGKRGSFDDLNKSIDFINKQNTRIVEIERGGKITCHAPGQAIVYPIVDIDRLKLGVKDFVYKLEEIMILISKKFSIAAKRNPVNNGIWVDNSKLGSIGLSIKKGVSMHGFSVNVYNDLEPFSWIKPCGLSDVSITSIKKQLKNRNHTENLQIMKEFKKQVIKKFEHIFNYEISCEKYDHLR